MKLLICTQIVDRTDPALGFFHRWVEEFALHAEEVHVICLKEGEHHLPRNVYVHSLGKEKGAGRATYLWRFFTLVWTLRHEYDSVFVHMNQIYVVLGASLWRLLGKRIGLWYAHGAVSSSLRLAVFLTHYVFTSTPQGLQLKTRKRMIVGQGIDFAHFTDVARVAPTHGSLRLITAGRIATSKNIDTLVSACGILQESGTTFRFLIVGAALTDADKTYEKILREQVANLKLTSHVHFAGAVTQADLPTYLREADVFIHDGATQSLDKALLEAAACGCVVVSSNPAYADFTRAYAPHYLFPGKDSAALARCLKGLASQSTEERDRSMGAIRAAIRAHHGISGLISAIVGRYD